jgi:beta-carotene hydroxylase
MTSELKKLNIQATAFAKLYMARFAWFTVLMSLLVTSIFVFSLYLFQQKVISVWIALVLVSILTYFSYTPLHEAVHGNINGKHKNMKWLNDLCGYMVAPLIAIPYTSHRYEHMAHHAFTNQVAKDPDVIMQGMQKGPWAVFKISLQFLWVQNTYFFQHQWTKSNPKEKTIYCIEVIISLAWRVIFILWLSSLSALMIIIIGYLIGGTFTAYWFAYRPHLPYLEVQRYKNTASLIMPNWLKPLEWYWLGQNLHSIHHLFPRIPFYHYHKVHQEIESVMKAHGTQVIGIFTRKPK